MASILTTQQTQALSLIAKTNLAKTFYFTGGTALAHFYLNHRYSEDLDFFNFEEFDAQAVVVALKSLKSELEYLTIDTQTSFNRNLFFLNFRDQSNLKLEFTHFPFQQIEQPPLVDGLLIDSALDIAVNKLFTISQKARGRDYFDLYCLINKYNYTLDKLRMLAKQKFDWHVDPLQLSSKLYEVDKFLDDPIMVKSVNKKKLVEFFQNESKKFSEEILTD